jgi:hypothetical protein
MARESLDIVTLVFANRTYEILKGELRNVGAGEPGRKARDMLEIGRPDFAERARPSPDRDSSLVRFRPSACSLSVSQSHRHRTPK